MVNRRSAIGVSAGVAILGASAIPRGWGEPVDNAASNGFRWLDEFSAKGKGASDDTGTFQRAIDYVRNLALRARDTYGLPSLLIPAGRYVLTQTIDAAPWIKLCSVGGVLLDFSRLPVGSDGLTCRNETTLPATQLRFPGERSPFLDGSGGTISILGPGTARAEGSGVVMGNREAGFSGDIRDAGGRNVVVSGWRSALRIDPLNTYLTAWFSSRFEQNREAGIYVAPGVGRSVNSGERMTFVDCTFAGSARALDIDSDSMDFVFDACSFDFHGDVVHFGAHARFGTVAFSHCHIEGIDGLLVNASAAGTHLRAIFRDSIVLPRHWKRRDLDNSPRLLVAGTAKFAACGVEWRFESPQRHAVMPLIGDEVPVEALDAISFQKIRALPWRGAVINADSRFTMDSPGTSASALSHWSLSSGASGETSEYIGGNTGEGQTARAAGAIVALDAPAVDRAVHRGRHALRLSAPDNNGAPLSITTRHPFAVTAGETVHAACTVTVAMDGTQGRTVFTFQFYAAAGMPLGAADASSAANQLPFAQAVVPAGAIQATLKTSFVNWTGQFDISELAVWRSS